MIDTLLDAPRDARERATIARATSGSTPRGYALVTLHRPSNVDDPRGRRAHARRRCATWPSACRSSSPCTRARARRLAEFGLLSASAARAAARHRAARLPRLPGAAATGAAGAHRLGRHPGRDHRARRALPDAPREHGTADHGDPRHQPASSDSIRPASAQAVDDIMTGRGFAPRIPELWDGHAAERIVEILASRQAP